MLYMTPAFHLISTNRKEKVKRFSFRLCHPVKTHTHIHNGRAHHRPDCWVDAQSVKDGLGFGAEALGI